MLEQNSCPRISAPISYTKENEQLIHLVTRRRRKGVNETGSMGKSKSTNPDQSRVVIGWTDEELSAAAAAYLQMLRWELEGIPFIKSAVNKSLRQNALAGRQAGSIEFRMQNISATLYDLRIPHIGGYLPARNVGSGVKERIKAALEVNGLDAFRDYASTPIGFVLDERVSALRKKPLGAAPRGAERPAQVI